MIQLHEKVSAEGFRTGWVWWDGEGALASLIPLVHTDVQRHHVQSFITLWWPPCQHVEIRQMFSENAEWEQPVGHAGRVFGVHLLLFLKAGQK